MMRRLEQIENQLATAKEKVTSIISRALAGYEPDYKTKDGYVQWGLVEKDIIAAFDEPHE